MNMNKVKIYQFCIFVLTLFLAEIISVIVKEHLPITYNWQSPYKLTAFKMGVTLIIYYPLFSIIETLAKFVSKKFISKTKKATGSGSLGLILAFTIGLFSIYCYFLYDWYQVNIFHVLTQYLSRKF
jgi:Co/Zn/Cd efflux system component